jgi:hypothetical protein
MFPYEYILMDGNIYMSRYIYTQGKKVAKHPCIQYPLDKKKGWSALCMYTHLGIDINSLLNLIAISLEYLVANKICHPLNWESLGKTKPSQIGSQYSIPCHKFCMNSF